MHRRPSTKTTHLSDILRRGISSASLCVTCKCSRSNMSQPVLIQWQLNRRLKEFDVSILGFSAFVIGLCPGPGAISILSAAATSASRSRRPGDDFPFPLCDDSCRPLFRERVRFLTMRACDLQLEPRQVLPGPLPFTCPPSSPHRQSYLYLTNSRSQRCS